MQLEYEKLLKKEAIQFDLLPLDIVTRINKLDADIKHLRKEYKHAPTILKRELRVKNKIDLGICDAIRDWIKAKGKKNAPFPFIAKKEHVNHPSHYGGADNLYEAIKVIEAWDLGFNLGNTVKYISRAGKKDAVLQELEKAAWYLQREIGNLKKKKLERSEMESIFGGGPISEIYGFENVEMNIENILSPNEIMQKALKEHKESFDKLLQLGIVKIRK